MSLTANSSPESARRKFFTNSTHTMHREVGIKRFWAQDAEMSLIAISQLESARRKFFMNSTYIMSTKQESLVFKLGCQNESNSHQLARIGEKNIFHELDVHHVYKVEIKLFLAHETEMSITAINSLESARRKYFMNSTYIMSTKQESLVFKLGCQNESNSHQLARIGEKNIFHELDVHHVYKVGIKRFWPQEAKMSLTANTPLESARRKFFMNLTYIMSTNQESLVFGLRRPK